MCLGLQIVSFSWKPLLLTFNNNNNDLIKKNCRSWMKFEWKKERKQFGGWSLKVKCNNVLAFYTTKIIWTMPYAACTNLNFKKKNSWLLYAPFSCSTWCLFGLVFFFFCCQRFFILSLSLCFLFNRYLKMENIEAIRKFGTENARTFENVIFNMCDGHKTMNV